MFRKIKLMLCIQLKTRRKLEAQSKRCVRKQIASLSDDNITFR